ncbi:MAG: extracellular solute-binding protein [Chloroflexota bacterium]|nr:extracellular solute-binding protein [Chloroflexota bacterium]
MLLNSRITRVVIALTFALVAFGGMALAQDTDTVVIWTPGDAKFATEDLQVAEANRLLQMIEESTNTQIEIVQISWDGYGDRLRAAAASGELPDIFSYYQHNDKNLITQFAEDGLILPFNGDLASLLPTVLTEYEGTPFTSELNVDGNIYMRPSTWGGGTQPNLSLVHVRQDVLDTLGLAQPETFEDFANYLTQCQEATGMNGLVFPGGEASIFYVNVFAGAFGLPFQGWVRTDNGFESPLIQAGMRDGLLILRQMIADGLVDPVTWELTNGNEAKERFIAGSNCAMLFNGGPIDLEIQAALETNVPDAVQLTLPALTTGDGVRGYTMEPQWATATFIAGLPNNHPEAAARVLDYLTTAEFARLSVLGIEGVHYDMVDGQVQLNEEARLQDGFRPTSDTVFGAHPLAGGVMVDWLNAWRDAEAYEVYIGWGKSSEAVERYNTWQENAGMYQIEAFGMFSSTPALAEYQPTLNEIVIRDFLSIIRADTAEEATTLFDTFVQSWLSAGGQQVQDEMSAYLLEVYGN